MLKGLERLLCSGRRPEVFAPAVLSDCLATGPTVAQGSTLQPVSRFDDPSGWSRPEAGAHRRRESCVIADVRTTAIRP